MSVNRIVVSSNCQSNGLALALRNLLPGAEVIAAPFAWPLEPGKAEELGQKVAASDFWLTIGQPADNAKVIAAAQHAPTAVIQIPAIGFSAFHPDLCYVRNGFTGQLTSYHYNSAIVAWAYKNNVDLNDTIGLFNPGTYQQLGYFDQWQSCVDFLQRSFRGCGLEAEFPMFFLNIQRTGNFMHSSNHPRIHVLLRLAKILALRVGHDRGILQKHLELEDELSAISWPMYPEIARELSLDGGSYNWKISSSRIYDGVAAYVEYCFEGYRTEGLLPAHVEILNREYAALHKVLAARLRCN
jgi:hypothetical protein